MLNIKEYRFIKNKEIIQEISAQSEAKVEEELGNDYKIGCTCNFEVDIHNIGYVLAFYTIRRKIKTEDIPFTHDTGYVGNVITPLYIPEAKNLNEVINNLTSNVHIKFQIFPSTLKGEEPEGFARYEPTFIIIIYISDLVKIDEDDCIYNVLPPKGMDGVFIIHEAYENGQLFKTLIDLTDLHEPKLIQTNRPKNGIFNQLIHILCSPFNEKFNNGKEYFKL